MTGDVVITGALVALPPTLLALATLISSLRNGRRSGQIHDLVNSEFEKVKRELKAVKKENRALRVMVKDLNVRIEAAAAVHTG